MVRQAPTRWRSLLIFEFDADRHVLDAVDEVRAEALDRAGDLEAGQPRDQLLEHHADLQPRQVRTETDVGPPAAERHVRVRVAADVEALGVREDLLVVVGRYEPHDDLVALPD